MRRIPRPIANSGFNYVKGMNMPYLFAAFSIVWLGLFSYLFYLGKQQKMLENEIQKLKGKTFQQ
ncbi:MAG: CcmD family protein [Chlamydiae bacterium]|nr:CcmD family protein [Chlamydiota bacterium]